MAPYIHGATSIQVSVTALVAHDDLSAWDTLVLLRWSG
jgi:hypothetical protein